MKLSDIIYERLKLTKDSLSMDINMYKEVYGDGEIKIVRDILNTKFNKNEIPLDIIAMLKEYFDGNDNVWFIKQRELKEQKIQQNIEEQIAPAIQSIKMKVYYSLGLGFYIKSIKTDELGETIALVIKEFNPRMHGIKFKNILIKI